MNGTRGTAPAGVGALREPARSKAEENEVLEIIVLGRGGQGAQTAGNLLASAFFAEGRHVQSFATYGGARRGTPVTSTIRVDNRPIRLRCDIDRADAILCFDASLLDARFLRSADADTLIVVNSARTADEFAGTLPQHRVLPVDGLAISRRNALGRIVNSALVGALARAIGAPSLAVMRRTLIAAAPTLHDENVAACGEGWACVDDQLRPGSTAQDVADAEADRRGHGGRAIA